MKFKKIRLYSIIIISCTFIFISGCKKFIEVDTPVTSISGDNVFETDALASAAVTGIYAKMSSAYFSYYMSVVPELSADNMTLYNQSDLNFLPYYQNSLTANYTFGNIKIWDNIYPLVYAVNTAIEKLNIAEKLTPTVKKRLLGEAYFLRGFYYFYLVNYYGDVPLVVSSNYANNVRLKRSSTHDVYAQILSDLNQAKELLDNNFVDANLIASTSERVRPNKMAAYAMLARVYLYTQNYVAAEEYASLVINNADFSVNIPLNDIFLKNSKETIWSLQPVTATLNTYEGYVFNLPDQGPNGYPNEVYLSLNLLNQFEPGDRRKTEWTKTVLAQNNTYSYANKYKITRSGELTEYPIILRIAEQYFIRAEARAEQNNIIGSQQDLNSIRSRSGLEDTNADNKEDLISAILKERRIEFFTEWGNRWLDLRRTGKINEVMTAAAKEKGAEWQPFKSLYPIPLTEIKNDNQLTQNPGYN